jgi:hypothetical protein
MTEICGLEHLYSDRTCVLPAGHDDFSLEDWRWLPHQASDGYRWERHEETYAEGTADEGVEQWDEPVDERHDGADTFPRVALLDETGVLIQSYPVPVPLAGLKRDDSITMTMHLTIT